MLQVHPAMEGLFANEDCNGEGASTLHPPLLWSTSSAKPHCKKRRTATFGAMCHIYPEVKCDAHNRTIVQAVAKEKIITKCRRGRKMKKAENEARTKAIPSVRVRDFAANILGSSNLTKQLLLSRLKGNIQYTGFLCISITRFAPIYSPP